MHSYHIFSFPFMWFSDSSTMEDPGNRLSQEIENLLVDQEGSKWKRDQMVLDTVEEYNDQVYFYPFTHQAFFDLKGTFDSTVLKRFTYCLGEHPVFYRIKTREPEKEFSLYVQAIELLVYQSYVGILSIKLENREYPDLDDILRINDVGRRIYPQYLSRGKTPEEKLEKIKHNFLAERIVLESAHFSFSDDFLSYARLNMQGTNSRQFPWLIKQILGPSFTLNVGIQGIKFQNGIDDRMHVVCLVNSALLSGKVIDYFKEEDPEKRIDTVFGDKLYQLIYVDGKEKTIQNDGLQKEKINTHTYQNWVKSGTLYGISRYSFVGITNLQDAGFILDHFRGMYLKMVQLALAQRCRILWFSGQIKGILAQKDKLIQSEKIQNLNKEYLIFVNSINFKEVTAQDQGIDLFDRIQKEMRLEDQLTGLKAEISELYQYTKMVEDDTLNRTLSKLTTYGLAISAVSLVLGFFGMSTITENFQKANCFFNNNWIPFTLSISTFFAVLWATRKMLQRKNRTLI